MTFSRANFACGNNAANAPAMHMYKTTDTAATINTSGYFNSLSGILRVGDIIAAYTDSAGTPQGYFFWVISNSSGVVDVADGLAMGTTNTD